MDLAALRQEYMRAGLHEKDLAPDPFAQFGNWFDEALQSGIALPNAMTLATATKKGRPSARAVLLKGGPFWSRSPASSRWGARSPTAAPRRTSFRTARTDRAPGLSRAGRHACIPGAGRRDPFAGILPAAMRVQAAGAEEHGGRPEHGRHAERRAERAGQERHAGLAHVDERHAYSDRLSGPPRGGGVVQQGHHHRL